MPEVLRNALRWSNHTRTQERTKHSDTISGQCGLHSCTAEKERASQRGHPSYLCAERASSESRQRALGQANAMQRRGSCLHSFPRNMLCSSSCAQQTNLALEVRLVRYLPCLVTMITMSFDAVSSLDNGERVGAIIPMSKAVLSRTDKRN